MKAKKIGIWMDHHQANLTEFTAETMESKLITSEHDREQNFSKGENHRHNKEQREQDEYYKRLGAVIQQYEEVVLFGPTDAKTELLHFLKKNHSIDNITVLLENADKMTENQQHAFVRTHFSRH